MNLSALFLLCFVALWPLVLSGPKVGIGPGLQDWGYYTVRPGAHMFYWLHYTLARVARFDERPLIISLQGGPGVASSGVGNFAQTGPIDIFLRTRKDSWVNDYNVLYIDNPVGVGFSYVEDDDLLAQTDEQIAADMVEFLRQFFQADSGVQKAPVYFVGTSYAGKMITEIAVAFEAAIKAGDIDVQFKGFAIGNPSIATVDSALSYAPYLLQMGLIEDEGFQQISQMAAEVKALADEGKWLECFQTWSEIIGVVTEETLGLSPYNVLLPFFTTQGAELGEYFVEFMNGHVAKTLGTNVTWDFGNPKATEALNGVFMKPVDLLIGQLLNETDIKVVVFSGHLDLVIAHPGTVNWIRKLQWRDREAFLGSKRVAIVNPNEYIDAHLKHYGNFYLYTVIGAAHNVVIENTAAMKYILKEMTGF